jgi:enoyl-CoA hydratase
MNNSAPAPPAAKGPVYETDEPVLYETRGATAWITLNRPTFNNAQNMQLTYALDRAFACAAADRQVRAIVLQGAGKHFCAGHDIGSPGRDVDFATPSDRHSLWWGHVGTEGAETAYVREQEIYLGMCRRWRALPKPTVAAVHGACIAGGLALAWICDLIVASEDAYFADPVLKLGVPGVEYFAHAFEMHPRAAREFLFLGERMSAQRAFQVGMVNRVVAREQLTSEVEAICARLETLPPFGAALAKQAFNHVEEARGQRAAMDAVFHIHHLAHAQNQLLSGDLIGGARTKLTTQPGS